MIQISTIRNNPEMVVEQLRVRNFESEEMVYELLATDRLKRETQKTLDDTLAESNTIARNIARLFKEGKSAEAEKSKKRSTELKAVAKELTEKLAELEQKVYNLLVMLPNTPNALVPPGKNSNDNVVVETYDQSINIPTSPLPHWDLAVKFNLINFEMGAKVTGSGFPFYIGKGAKLQRALISFFLDKASEAGYIEYQTPLMVNEESAFGTGQLPDKEGQMYLVAEDNLYLIPTAEVPLTNIFRNTILKEDELPIKICAYSSCFRREAGSYGKDVRGLNRLHQFDKVEIVHVAHPENSYNQLEKMVQYVAQLLTDLKLPFRLVKLCGGDLSFASAMTYDFEVWSAAQQRWLEVSSVSNFETFQSNRMKIRYRNNAEKIELAHTLNGSALALPRIVAAILENNQTENTIKIPEVLVPYMGFSEIN